VTRKLLLLGGYLSVFGVFEKMPVMMPFA